MFLTPDDLRYLTDRRTKPAQRRALDALGVRYGVRPDGSLIVLQSAVEAAIGPAQTKTKTPAFKLHHVSP